MLTCSLGSMPNCCQKQDLSRICQCHRIINGRDGMSDIDWEQLSVNSRWR